MQIFIPNVYVIIYGVGSFLIDSDFDFELRLFSFLGGDSDSSEP